MRRLGSEITVSSRPGAGSRFSFDLSVPMVEPADRHGLDAMAGKNVLVISPGAVEAQAIAATITAFGGKAVISTTLRQAALLLEKSNSPDSPDEGFSALLIDPEISKDPARSLARLMRRTARRPFCVVLVHPAGRGKLPQLLVDGFDAYLVRPLRRSSLLRVVGEQRTEQPETKPQRHDHKPLLGAGETLARLEVLIAEDNPVNALLVRTVFDKAGQGVTMACDGRQALEACRKLAREGRQFDLVLMDLHMPVLDGLSAITAIRKLEKRAGLARTRILTLTADEQTQAREQSRMAGGDGFITKPVSPQVLMELIRAQAGKQPQRVKSPS
jgi:CheY-like chemotaxis protein